MTAPQAPIVFDVVALSGLNDDRYAPLRDAVVSRLESFDCQKSSHLEQFARSEVHRWEAHGHSRTYVMITPDDEHGVEVAAFFTVGMVSLDLTTATPNQRKKLCGAFSMTQTGAYSIAELARSDRFSNAELPGSVILGHAMSVIKSSRALVAGRFVVVDSQKPVFDALYEPAGFRHISVANPPKGMEDKEFITSCFVMKAD